MTKSIQLETSLGVLVITPTGLKVSPTSRKVIKDDVSLVLTPYNKGERRVIRKKLHGAGHIRLAQSGTRSAKAA